MSTASRLQNYVVVVTDTRPTGDKPSYESSNICASRKDSHANTLNLRCYKATKGRYVMIQLKNREFLTLCEVRVYTKEG